MHKAGLDYLDKNRIRDMREDGATVDEIAHDIGCDKGMVINYILFLSKNPKKSKKGSTVGDEGEMALQAILAEQAGDSDEFGPLPGSPEWEELSGPARGGLTRKRNNAQDINDEPDNSAVHAGADEG